MEEFDLVEVPAALEPRFNIAPGGDVAVVVNRGARRLEMFHWGLIPRWAKDPSIGNRLINARAETAAEKPSFRAALRQRRCLVLADGFYEWKGKSAPKTPMYMRMKNGAPFAFAGLWETWQPPAGMAIESCAILTTEPNSLLAPIHNRMPVILTRKDYAAWLDPKPCAGAQLVELLQPFPADRMEAYEVSTLVNRPTNDDASCIEPL